MVKKKKFKKNKLKYSLSFASLIFPFIKNKLFFLTPVQEFHHQKKVYLKQSYILLTWLHYLTFLNLNIKEKNKLTIFVAPSKKLIFTNTKAPIAHKTRSKEQYQFNFFNYKVSIKKTSVIFDQNNLNIEKFFEKKKKSSLTTAESLFFLLITKKNFPNFETNIFHLKNYKTFLTFSDPNYFNFFFFNDFKL